jgi:hypothetical protein
MEIKNWTYTIFDRTGNSPSGDALYGNVHTILDRPSASKIVFNDFETACITQQATPWNACKVPDAISFTILQRMPPVGYLPNVQYFTDLFKLPGGNDYAYLLKGKIEFNRKMFSIKRNTNSSLLEYSSTRYTTLLDSNYESLYTSTKIGAILNIFMQLNGTYNPANPYEWRQLISLIPTSTLIRDLSNYSSSDYVQEMTRRFAVSTQYWLENLLPGTSQELQIPIETGQRIDLVWIGFSFVSSLSILFLGILLMLYMLFYVLRSNRATKIHPNSKIINTEIFPVVSHITYTDSIETVSFRISNQNDTYRLNKLQKMN